MPGDITRGGEIYFIQEQDFLTGEMTPYTKIGLVRDDRASSDRKSDHQTANPRNLVLHSAVKVAMVQTVEKNLHWHFAPRRVMGEWFVLSEQELRDAITKCESLGKEYSEYVASIRRAEELEATPSNAEMLASSESAEDWRRRQQTSALILKRADVVAERYKNLLPKKSQPYSDFNEDGFKQKFPELWEKFLAAPEVGGSLRVSKLPEVEIVTSADVAAQLTAVSQFDDLVALCEKNERSLDDLAIDYLRFISLTKHHETIDEIAKFHLKEICGVTGGIEGVCSWKRVLKPAKLDREKLKQEESEKYQAFVTQKTREIPDTSRLAGSRAAD